MKKMGISLAAAAFVFLGTNTAQADSLSEAFINGKVSGDISVTYEGRKMKDEPTSRSSYGDKYFHNTAYSVASIGLEYKTAAYYGFSADAAFRAYKKLYENDDKDLTAYGKGDASDRFREKDFKEENAAVAKAYLAWDNKNIHLKLGRDSVYTEWMTKNLDGIFLNANYNDTNIEALWVSRRGRMTPREYRYMVQTNNHNGGTYKLGIKQKITDYLTAKIYSLYAPDKFSSFGGKINLDLKNNNFLYGGMLQGIATDEDKYGKINNGKMIQAIAYANMIGYKITLGYVATDSEGGWGSIGDVGDTIVPFEEGDAMYDEGGTDTVYASIYKSFGDFNATILYGEMERKNNARNGDTDKELDIWLGYNFIKNLSINIGYTHYDAQGSVYGSSDFNGFDQLNTTLVYKF